MGASTYDGQQVKEARHVDQRAVGPALQGPRAGLRHGGHNFSIAALSLGKPNPFRLDEAGYKEAAEHLIALRRNVLTFYSLPEESVQLFRDHKVALLFAKLRHAAGAAAEEGPAPTSAT
jgi:putative spermidine/putrescine transport system substrate-binding protein